HVAILVQDVVPMCILFRPAEADFSQARLMADDDPLLAGLLASRADWATLHDIFHADRHVIDGSNHHLADLPETALLFGSQVVDGLVWIGHAEHLLHRIPPAANQADATHVLNGTALEEKIATDIAIAGSDGVLDLLQRDAVPFKPVRVGVDL